MQVSWIDPEELARLAAELNGPLPSAEPPASWDLSTLPELSADALMPHLNHALPAGRHSAFDPSPESDYPETPAPTAHAQLDHIREKLRAIRTRAQDAGLLPKPEAPPAEQPPAPPAPAAPEIAPASVAAPTTPAPEAAPASPPASPHAFLNLDGTLTERLGSFMAWAQTYAPSKEILLVDDHGELLWGNPSHPELALSAVLAANVQMRTGAHAVAPQAANLNLGKDRHLTVLPCTTRLGLVTLAILNAQPLLSNDQLSCLREALTLSVEGKQ
jgi:hypothetical protein